MKKIFVFIFIFCILYLYNVSYGSENVMLYTDKNYILKDDEFTVSINVKDISVVALTIRLNFDINKVDPVEIPKNSNVVGNKILFIWFDETGDSYSKNNNTIADFKFRAIEKGDAKFEVEGMFFDKNETKIPVTFSDMKVIINEEEENELKISQEIISTTSYLPMKVEKTLDDIGNSEQIRSAEKHIIITTLIGILVVVTVIYAIYTQIKKINNM